MIIIIIEKLLAELYFGKKIVTDISRFLVTVVFKWFR